MNKSGFTIIKEGELYGLVDENLKVVVPCEYDNILDYDDDGYIRLLKGNVYSTINLKGEKVIPLSKGLTHLGVFWGGTARAKIGEGWGLVDEYGDAVTDFTFTQINAHGKNKNGYFAIDADGVKGWLLEDGEFCPFKNQTAVGKKTKFQVVRVFHHGIAPALTWEGRWVFVNEQLEPVNDFSYEGLDPVLREGIYLTFIKSGGGYGAAFYDGRPIVDMWFSGPLHFENGLVVCCKKRTDENGNDVKKPKTGFTAEDCGILRSDGSWLFPMEYSSIHWNNYKKKDCWYAEDERACYLLYPDGSRKVYDKCRSVKNWANLPYIPEEEMGNDIPEWMLENTYEPKLVVEKHLKVFNREKFENALSPYTWLWFDPLQLYYRDTDAEFDIDKHYKVGRVLRAGHFMEATTKLRRPIHKVRFLIAATRLFSVEKYLKDNRGGENPFPFKENIIYPNACFVVMDVYRTCGKTQILLLKIPYGAYLLGKEHGFKFRYMKAGSKFSNRTLKEFARDDFNEKMTDLVHGHSLDEGWTHAMRQPVGLDESMKPVPLERDFYSPVLERTDGAQETPSGFMVRFGRYLHDQDNDWDWQNSSFMMKLRNPIKVVVGDITKLRVDAIVNAANTTLLGGGGVDGAIHAAAGPGLLEVCRRMNGCVTGRSKLTNGYDLPCKRIIHTVGPVWKGGDNGEDKLLASCYRTSLNIAIKKRLLSIAFPCISTGANGFPRERAAKIALGVIVEYMKSGKYPGDVILCCHSDSDAEIYKGLLEE